MNIEQLREDLNCLVEHLGGEHAGKVVVNAEKFNTIYDHAATLLRVVENMPKETPPEGDEYHSGFNACRTEIINLIGVKP